MKAQNNAYAIYRLKLENVTTYHYFSLKKYSREQCEAEGFEFIEAVRSERDAIEVLPKSVKN